MDDKKPWWIIHQGFFYHPVQQKTGSYPLLVCTCFIINFTNVSCMENRLPYKKVKKFTGRSINQFPFILHPLNETIWNTTN